jgi:hypothetical protein
MHRFHAGTAARCAFAPGLLALGAAAVLSHGCTSASVPTAPGGGKTLHLSYAVFASTVEPILTRQGCDAGGDCHGGGIRGTLQLSPAGAKDTLADFAAIGFETNAYFPDSSLVLRKPLALSAGGLPHSAKPFATTGDPDYQAIRQWIFAGVQP